MSRSMLCQKFLGRSPPARSEYEERTESGLPITPNVKLSLRGPRSRSRSDKDQHWQKLDTPTWTEIVRHLDVLTLLAISCTNKEFKSIAAHNSVWRYHVLRLTQGNRLHVGPVDNRICKIDVGSAACVAISHYVFPDEYWKHKDDGRILNMMTYCDAKLVFRGTLCCMLLHNTSVLCDSAGHLVGDRANRLQRFAFSYLEMQRHIMQNCD